MTALHQRVWATLPRSLDPRPDEARLVALDGGDRSWPEALGTAVRGGARGVLLDEPTLTPTRAEVERALDAADSAAVPVVVHRAWASHPAVADLAAWTPSAPGLVDCVATVPAGSAWLDVVAAQLAVLRSLGAPVGQIEAVVTTPSGATVHGSSGSAAVVLAVLRGPTTVPLLRTAVHGDESEIVLEAGSVGEAAPMRCLRIDSDGATERPSSYESALRASWRRLADTVTTGDVGSEAVGLLADLDQVSEVAAAW